MEQKNITRRNAFALVGSAALAGAIGITTKFVQDGGSLEDIPDMLFNLTKKHSVVKAEAAEVVKKLKPDDITINTNNLTPDDFKGTNCLCKMRYTILDHKLTKPDMTYDEVYEDWFGFTAYALVCQIESYAPIYYIGDEKYCVLKFNKFTDQNFFKYYIDACFAHDNDRAELIDGVVYDIDLGLAYIPIKALSGDDPTVTCQLLCACDISNYPKSNITVDIESEVLAIPSTTKTIKNEGYDFAFSVQVAEPDVADNISVNNIILYIDGFDIPILDESIGATYNQATGVFTIKMFPLTIQNVTIKIKQTALESTLGIILPALETVAFASVGHQDNYLITNTYDETFYPWGGLAPKEQLNKRKNYILNYFGWVWNRNVDLRPTTNGWRTKHHEYLDNKQGVLHALRRCTFAELPAGYTGDLGTAGLYRVIRMDLWGDWNDPDEQNRHFIGSVDSYNDYKNRLHSIDYFSDMGHVLTLPGDNTSGESYGNNQAVHYRLNPYTTDTALTAVHSAWSGGDYNNWEYFIENSKSQTTDFFGHILSAYFNDQCVIVPTSCIHTKVAAAMGDTWINSAVYGRIIEVNDTAEIPYTIMGLQTYTGVGDGYNQCAQCFLKFHITTGLRIKKTSEDGSIGDDESFRFALTIDEWKTYAEDDPSGHMQQNATGDQRTKHINKDGETTTHYNAIFTNGTHEFELKPGEQMVFRNLPSGYHYTVEETAPNGVIQTWTNKTGTIVLHDTEANYVTVTCDNKRSAGITITKTGTSISSTQEFEFQLTLNNRTDKASETFGGNTFTNGVCTFTLTKGESKTFTDIPDGTTYSIIETEVPNMTTTWTGPQTGTIDATTTPSVAVTCNNELNSGSITIKKISSDSSYDSSEVFNFTLKLTIPANGSTPATPFNGTIDGKTFANGVYQFSLHIGESLVITDIPEGYLYEVTEEELDDNNVQWQNRTGTIHKDSPVQVTADNCSAEILYTLTVKKEVISESAELFDPEQEFTFHMTIKTDTNQPYKNETFTLKHNETKRFVDLPAGYKWTLTEDPIDDYQATITPSSGTLGGDNDTVQILCKNYRSQTGFLKVKKSFGN